MRTDATAGSISGRRELTSAMVIAAASVVLHMALATRYGYHRDELYFLAESKRLAWGFVSEPPLTPALARVSTALFGDSLVWLRFWPALAGAAVVVISARIARTFGGGLLAQSAAALCTGFATIFLSLFHLFGPSAFDQLAWAVCLWLVVRLLAGADPRFWLAVGVVAGVGLLNKQTLIMFAVGLAVALALVHRGHLRSPWPWLGTVVAVVIASPAVWWQASHGWPMREIAASISEDEGGLPGAMMFLPMQVLTMNPLLAPVWVAGLIWLFRSPQFRSLAVLYLVLFAFLILVGGRHYYVAPMYVVLFAAGGVAAERWLARTRRPVRPATVPVAIAVAVVLNLPTALPVLPVAAHRTLPIIDVNPVLAESLGWPGFVQQIATVRNQLPPEDGRSAQVLTANYGEAGAVERFGADYGLGRAFSGHNAYWTWGPPTSSVIVAVGFPDRTRLDELFGDVRRAGSINSPVDNEEQGAPIWICRDPVLPWPELWPLFKNYQA